MVKRRRVHAVILIHKNLEKVLIFHSLDIESDAIPPTWPLEPDSLIMDDATYELRAVPLTSIAFITNKLVKVKQQFKIPTRSL